MHATTSASTGSRYIVGAPDGGWQGGAGQARCFPSTRSDSVSVDVLVRGYLSSLSENSQGKRGSGSGLQKGCIFGEGPPTSLAHAWRKLLSIGRGECCQATLHCGRPILYTGHKLQSIAGLISHVSDMLSTAALLVPVVSMQHSHNHAGRETTCREAPTNAPWHQRVTSHRSAHSPFLLLSCTQAPAGNVLVHE
jgi:hypothetical protein